ncbi:general secretion pathway protein C [Pseudoduganella lurida]|uniref:General secretion pathway protein C n=1 Tax=Pseudoduganella lurida TaxID=1036180 RepID=A0A562R3U6_9BURK|nr:type II secretion system protein N [Pseudoduganella lurida]TWI63100.1 general secretion pathway protein C [Pseudoduganella lurida]
MNRLMNNTLNPTLASLAAVVVLTASTAYWGLQLFKPEQRPIAAVVLQELPPPSVDAARGLFGGQETVAEASAYELRGVVASPRGRSVAIIATNGNPPQAYPVGKEVAAGVTVQEVAPRYVMLMEGGVPKRLDLPADAGSSLTTAAPLPTVDRAVPPVPALGQAQPQAVPPAPSATPLVTPPPGTPVGAPGQLAPIQSAPAQRPVTSQ